MKKFVLLLLVGLGVIGCGNVSETVTLTGGGATFPYPLYSRWFYDYYKETGIQINYASLGSGAGISQARERTIDIGATDMPLSDEELEKDNLHQVHVVSGAVVPAINLPVDINLTGGALANIYRGTLITWNDPFIQELNPGVELPDLPIVVVHRSDGSGTTFIWASFLSDYSLEWSDNIGADTSLDWPTGIGAKGNAGVAGTVRELPGSIGYVEFAYAKETNMRTASIDGVAANMETFVSGDWPIIAPTYILIPLELEKSVLVRDFLEWAWEYGNDTAIELDYIPKER